MRFAIAFMRRVLVSGRLLIFIGKGQVGRFVEVWLASLGVRPKGDADKSENQDQRDESAKSSRIHNLTSALEHGAKLL